VGNVSSSIPCPVFGLKRPSDSSDEVIMSKIELEANALLGAYNWKYHKAFLECCSRGSRINRSFHEMGVKHESRETPLELQKRGRASGNIGSTEPAAKKGKKDVISVFGGSSSLVVAAKPPRNPSIKLLAKQAEIRKKKDVETSKYAFEIAECNLGSPAFMEALKATERSVPWGLGSRGRPIEIDIEQFGSLRVRPDSIGVVIIDLHKATSAPPRMVSLVDDDSDKDALEIPPKVDAQLAETSK
jgi:hypothetical protein